MGMSRVPESLVMRRWTVNAKGAEGPGADDGFRHAAPDLVALHSILYNASMELVVMGRESRQAFEVALSFMAKAKVAISSMFVVHPSPLQPTDTEGSDPGQECDESDQLKEVMAPPHVRSRGRPRQSRFKSPVESPGSQKRKRSSAKEKDVSDVFSSVETCTADVHEVWHTEPDVQSGSGSFGSGGKSRKRSCHLCGEKGHYKSTCGRKSTYTPKIAQPVAMDLC